MREDRPVAKGDPGDKTFFDSERARERDHRDPLTGAPGAHPLGVGVGAAAGGLATGAAVGSVAGPVGTMVGAAVGAIAGGLIGKGAAEMVDPTVEEAYWRDHYATRPYVADDRTYEDYAPAYRYGVDSYNRHYRRGYLEAETELAQGWDSAKGESRLGWDDARDAVRDAWDRASDRVERNIPG
jgi:hypothetical protein